MAAAPTQARPHASSPRSTGPAWLPQPGRWMMWTAAGVVVVIAILAFFINRNWPYRYKNVKPTLENVFASQVEVKEYSRTYFPRPGFVAHGFTLRRKSTDPNLPALGTAQTVIVQGGWLDLLVMRHHVEDVDVEGLHIIVPAVGTREREEDFPAGSSGDFSGPETSIGKLSLRDAIFELNQQNGKSLVFPIAKLVIHDMARGQPLHYKVDMTNPMPTGHILASGNFGPINPKNLGDTPLDGDYTFENAKLSDIGSLRGTLKAKGHFDKTLSSIAADSTAEASDFAVSDGRPEPVRAHIQCTINGLNGDIVLNSVDGKMASTPVVIRGTISGKPKTTKVDITVGHGRVQDLLQPFMHDRSPVVGPVSSHMRAEILPGKGDFLSRLRMDGSFDIPKEELTSKSTESSLSAFSERAQGGKEDAAQATNVDVMSSVEGPLTVRDGIVSTDRLVFIVPGASTNLQGTYSLRNNQAHLTGHLTMKADISHTTTGFKSVLLKPLAPFFKHKKDAAQPADTVVPIAVTGGPGAYKVSGNLLHDK